MASSLPPPPWSGAAFPPLPFRGVFPIHLFGVVVRCSFCLFSNQENKKARTKTPDEKKKDLLL